MMMDEFHVTFLLNKSHTMQSANHISKTYTHAICYDIKNNTCKTL